MPSPVGGRASLLAALLKCRACDQVVLILLGYRVSIHVGVYIGV
jgi:hypothetical protein